MPPKIDNEAFLACCFRNLREKPKVDFDAVAKETAMSLGGAQNKYRDIMKKMGVGDLKKDEDGTTEEKPRAKPKAKTREPKEPKAVAAKRPLKRKGATQNEEASPTFGDQNDGDSDVSSPQNDTSDNCNDEAEQALEESPKKKARTATMTKTKTKTAKARELTVIDDDDLEDDKAEKSSTDIDPLVESSGKGEDEI